jgi:hypothetical protein
MGFDEVAEQYRLGQYDEALSRLQYLHREWHARPREHVLIHYWQARIAVSQHRYRRAGWEWLAMLFAAPTSLVQKHTGLVRNNI